MTNVGVFASSLNDKLSLYESDDKNLCSLKPKLCYHCPNIKSSPQFQFSIFLAPISLAKEKGEKKENNLQLQIVVNPPLYIES